MVATHHEIDNLNQTIDVIEISIEKVDSDTNQPLSGALFGLYQDDVLIQEKVSDEHGKLFFIVEKGEWVIKEIKAPLGYQLSEEEYAINESVELVIQNKPVEVPELPQTGQENGIIFSLVGLTMVCGALWIFMKGKQD